MSTATQQRPLEIQCARPECHWSGSPAESAGHPCPTPAAGAIAEERAAAAAERGAALPSIDSNFLHGWTVDAEGKPVPDPKTDRTLPVWLVWTGPTGDTVVAGTYPDDEAAIAASASLQAAISTGELEIKRMPVDVTKAAQVAGAPGPAAPVEPEDPKTRDEIETWLAAHGNYDAAGNPQDERTATLDARLTSLEASEPEPVFDELEETIQGEPVALEPPLDAPPASVGEAIAAGEALQGDGTGETLPPIPNVEEAIATDGPPRPLELVVAERLHGQATHAENRWLVVYEEDGREAEVIGRARTRKDAKEIKAAAEKVPEGTTVVGTLSVLKTADVIARAEELEIERQRENVDEPDRVETPDEPPLLPEAEPGQTPEPPPEDVVEPDEEPIVEAGGQAAILDKSQYDREDLAIPPIDGQTIDRIAIGFSGRIMLDRSNPDHVALFNDLKLGKNVELRVAGDVSGTGAKGATDRDGDLDVVIGEKKVKVSTVYVLAPEEL